ncbi:asparagine synthase-related protein [Streptomyces sp. CdTB01]|uniref:asparagine synthase-related protein n=1 Tax=Streptomyces sp. CdTB01 TaxID=1725411 RepID=UPI00099E223E|nr:asparagine synthase-related protein [Streptomyces sp. CdTB01]NUP31481.1 asparagine synthase [Streptomycetaceae bacterium]
MSKGFVVLPDAPGIHVTDTTRPFNRPNVIGHPSGRPWLVGEWDPDEILEMTASPVRVVVIGFCPVTTTRLADRCRRIRTLSEAGTLATELPGSFHLLAAAGRTVHVYGGLSGLRQVFHARSGHLPIASDRADVLASMTGAGIDESALAARLVCGGLLPPPLSDRSVWAGVSTVAHDHRLVLEPDGAREERWWYPPEPDTPLIEGAAHLTDALVTAMDGRRAGSGTLGADLSGGMDSTSLCFLAARHTPDLLTFRWGEAEAGNDDAYFAGEAAHALPGARHVVAPQHELPSVFARPDAAADAERPYLFSRTLARVRHSVRLLSDHGVHRHIAGHGGDELFGRAPGYLHRLARRHPTIAVRHLRGYRALHRWPLAGLIQQLRRRGDVRDWWLAQAAELTLPAPPRRTPSLDWGLASLRAPAWATDTAVEAAREALRDTARHAQPFARDRGQHQFLTALRTTAPAYRQVARLYEEAGVRLEQPYLDNQVVEAALAVRLHERVTPRRYKPLLATSMRGLVPDVVLDRTTKGEFSADLRAGRQRNLTALLDLFSDSLLSDMGLISTEELRSQLLTPHSGISSDIAVEELIGLEIWARAAGRFPLTAGRR